MGSRKVTPGRVIATHVDLDALAKALGVDKPYGRRRAIAAAKKPVEAALAEFRRAMRKLSKLRVDDRERGIVDRWLDAALAKEDLMFIPLSLGGRPTPPRDTRQIPLALPPRAKPRAN